MLGSLSGQSKQFAKAVDSLSELVEGLNARKQDISNGVAYANAAAGSITGLLAQARPPLKKVVHEADRTAATILADHDYFDNFLNTWPDATQILNRQGMYGDFFSFYFCEIVLKVNGKGGQDDSPVADEPPVALDGGAGEGPCPQLVSLTRRIAVTTVNFSEGLL